MRMFLLKARWLLLGFFLSATMVSLWAQEPQQFNRGISVIQGNVTTSRGYVLSASPLRDIRTNTTEATAGAATYTAAELIAGLIQRTPGVGGNVTDVLPTAANLALAIPGVQVGHSFTVWVDMGATPGGSVTINGASTGVTYSGGCGTAIGTGDVTLILINFTSATAYRAVCLNVNT